MSKKESELKSASAMGAAVLISRVLGLVREQVFAAFFGASHANDAFQIAFRIPNLLRDLFAEGALSAALVPTFIRVRNDQGEKRGWQVATRVFVCLAVVVSLLAALGAYFAQDLARIYAPGFTSVPGKFELTVRLVQWMMPFFPLVALAAAFMAILNALGAFFIPAFSSAMFNLVSILVGLVGIYFSESLGIQKIEAMAFGVVAGGLAQACTQIPLLFKKGFRWNWNQPENGPWHRDQDLKRMMALMVPGTLGLAATQINILVNSVLATNQGEGAVSWLNYAFRLMQFPIGVFGVSLAAATLPLISRHWVQNKFEESHQSLLSSLERVFAINFPAAAGLAGAAVPIIAAIFERGAFQRDDTLATASALSAYAVGLGFYSAVKVMVPVCYAVGATRIAVASSVISVIANLGLNLLLIPYFGFAGLALGTSLTAILNAAFLWFFLRRIFFAKGLAQGIGRNAIRPFFGRLALHAAGSMILWLILRFFPLEPFMDSLAMQVLAVGLCVGIGIGFIFFWAKCFNLNSTLEIYALFARKLGLRQIHE